MGMRGIPLPGSVAREATGCLLASIDLCLVCAPGEEQHAVDEKRPAEKEKQHQRNHRHKRGREKCHHRAQTNQKHAV